VLKAANTAEFDHIRGLRQIGGRRLVDRYWIPEEAFGGGGAGLFASIEAVEVVEISAYLFAVTKFANRGHGRAARILAAAMGTEAEHRVLARFAQNALGQPRGVPNDLSFERLVFGRLRPHVRALEALGIGFGEQGSKPGRFYEFPGDPVRSGAGLPTNNRDPD